MSVSVERVLLYRLGSLGDFTVALPALHLVARTFPRARRVLLTNRPGDARAPAAREILADCGLVDEYVEYPASLRDPRQLAALARRLRKPRADVVVHLTVPRGRWSALRDAVFFGIACGIRRQVGVSASGALLDYRWIDAEKRYEHESERLSRCVAALGDAAPSNPESWDLRLTEGEHETARRVLQEGRVVGDFIACAIGTKFPTNDWGVENWRSALGELARLYPNLALVMIGSPVEKTKSAIAASEWPAGRKLDLCGRLSPRESAAVLQQALVYVGHDSGPIHLSASVGTPCVGVYSARHRPGLWFPYGRSHRVLYHQTPCFDCELFECTQFAKQCITSIQVSELVVAARDAVEKRLAEARRETGRETAYRREAAS